MQFSIVLALCASLLAVNASKLCADFVVKSTELLTVSSGKQFNLTRVSCPDGPTVTPKIVRSVKVRDLVKRPASECTNPVCFCGIECIDTECVASPGAINIADCSTLTGELIRSTGTFFIDPQEGAIITSNTCAYVAFNNLVEDLAEYCLNDFGNAAFDVLDNCQANEGICEGGDEDFFVEQLFN